MKYKLGEQSTELARMNDTLHQARNDVREGRKRHLSEIQDHPRSATPGHADHHGVVLRLLVLAENGVAMVRDAAEYRDLARSTGSLPAGEVGVDAFAEDGVENFLAISTAISQMRRGLAS